MLEKPLSMIAEADLQELVANGVGERRIIEYKRDLPGYTDEPKKEFLADISSFANASGGTIVYGMDAPDGIPIELTGFETLDIDGDRLRMENMIRDGISPRIIGIEIGEPVRLAGAKLALVVRVPKSWSSPHMVTFKGHSRFYSRNSAGKYPLNVEELRSAFSFSATAREGLRDFRAERLSRIGANSTPVPLAPDGALVVLHLVPLSSFELGTLFDVPTLAASYPRFKLQPLFSTRGWHSRPNFDGRVIFEQDQAADPAWSYVQMFRNGSFESVSESFLRYKILDSRRFERELIRTIVPSYLEIQKELGVSPPIFVGLSLVGVSGVAMTSAVQGPFSTNTRPFERDTLIVPEVVLESFDSNVATTLKPAFDTIWNAAGEEGSPYYKNSEWAG